MFSRHNVKFPVWRAAGRGVLLGLLLSVLALSGCRNDAPAAEATPAAAVPTQAPAAVAPTASIVQATAVPPTKTAVPPTPTPEEPLAALVNDAPIYLAEYEKELARYEQAQQELGQPLPPGYQAIVLDALIERLLITQAATASGIVVTPQMLEAKLAELRTTAGGDANFVAWLEANQWSEAEFRDALLADMLTAQVRDQVTQDVPYAVEQVRARYLQVNDAQLAASLLQQVQGGADFGLLAAQHSLDPQTAQAQGDLGFFARGSLLVPEIEAAAFALQPGEVSEVIAVTAADGSQTYYLVQVIERDGERPLTPRLRYVYLEQTFESWLSAQWEQAAITRFVNPNA
ncbi:MAG: peptidylprolyl isomerase [Anaerolineales bacterium]|nr:peptidylprolyl isomerase [Anaerolineales bacterium]